MARMRLTTQFGANLGANEVQAAQDGANLGANRHRILNIKNM